MVHLDLFIERHGTASFGLDHFYKDVRSSVRSSNTFQQLMDQGYQGKGSGESDLDKIEFLSTVAGGRI